MAVSSLDGAVRAITHTFSLVQHNVPWVLGIILVLWAIHVVNWLVGYRLNILGVHPRNVFGLVGIAASPFLHGSFNHLFFNTVPLFVLTNFVLLSGLEPFYCVTLMVMVIGGGGIWLLGRKALHVGASGVIMGYWSYLLMGAYQNPTALTLVLGFVSIYYFGALALSLFPTDVRSSWEGHVFGFVGGVAAYYLCPILLANA